MRVPGWHQQPVDPVSHDIAAPGHVGSDEGFPHGSGFQQGFGETFTIGGQDHHVGLAQIRPYVVHVVDGEVTTSRATAIPSGDSVLGGFHYAPGGNAPARSGGDDVPAINPCSLWDVAFRPACADQRVELVYKHYDIFRTL